ncbi:TetR/AcrR family transcriptional regulator [Rhodococcus sp. BL-253-APC-6A1W]|uniref:TetR/AcrR family transcriptional regulator n=1 Tax=unclassified Rhodococcus (in: high G+C Gram-positive bacteria) TaxID=192944 RepID=UPI00146B3386|nr:TetR/AcrR family transcriptional regulator [Rhodococcus sp. BL-253-APC-6A1W]NMD96309.1 TetR/AcrR family transcriptional regulator [Rhodococcus sp. BL-253-APC-6A1W]
MIDGTDTRTQIMRAFADQLAATGYSGISLVGVADDVGIRKPSIYHHFPGGKEDLYRAVAQEFIEGLHVHILEALGSDGPLDDRLTALAVVSSEHHRSTITFEQRIYDALDQVGETTREEISGLYVRKVLDPVVALFADAVDRNELTGEPEFLMNAFLHLARATESGGSAVARRITELFLNGARPRPDGVG